MRDQAGAWSRGLKAQMAAWQVGVKLGIAGQGTATVLGKPLAYHEVVLPVGFWARLFGEEDGRQRIFYDPSEDGAYDMAVQLGRKSTIAGGIRGIRGDIAVGEQAVRLVASALPGDEILDFIESGANGDGEGMVFAVVGVIIPGANRFDDLGSDLNKIENGVEDATRKVDTPAPRSGPIHHIATNKNSISNLRGGPWTPRFESIFKKAGMTLEDAANKIRIPGHAGPHPEAYHSEVFQRLQSVTDGLSGADYKAALLKELEAIAGEASTVGSRLNKLLTGS